MTGYRANLVNSRALPIFGGFIGLILFSWIFIHDILTLLFFGIPIMIIAGYLVFSLIRYSSTAIAIDNERIIFSRKFAEPIVILKNDVTSIYEGYFYRGKLAEARRIRYLQKRTPKIMTSEKYGLWIVSGNSEIFIDAALFGSDYSRIREELSNSHGKIAVDNDEVVGSRMDEEKLKIRQSPERVLPRIWIASIATLAFCVYLYYILHLTVVALAVLIGGGGAVLFSVIIYHQIKSRKKSGAW